ncbi:unnamed protein product [Symbiodinium sp. KB8]|nr:unnamed protein product [Symbiodinium sp. KB8]
MPCHQSVGNEFGQMKWPRPCRSSAGRASRRAKVEVEEKQEILKMLRAWMRCLEAFLPPHLRGLLGLHKPKRAEVGWNHQPGFTESQPLLAASCWQWSWKVVLSCQLPWPRPFPV